MTRKRWNLYKDKHLEIWYNFNISFVNNIFVSNTLHTTTTTREIKRVPTVVCYFCDSQLLTSWLNLFNDIYLMYLLYVLHYLDIQYGTQHNKHCTTHM